MVEVKARSRKGSPSKKMINQTEREHLKAGGKLELCLINFSPKKCTIRIYDVIHKSDNKDGIRDIFVSTKRETIEEEMKENMDPNHEDFRPVSTYPRDITERVSRLYLTVGQEKVASFIIEEKGEREWQGRKKKVLLLKKESARRGNGDIKIKPAPHGGYRYV